MCAGGCAVLVGALWRDKGGGGCSSVLRERKEEWAGGGERAVDEGSSQNLGAFDGVQWR